MDVMSTILATLASCCFANRLVKPVMGFRRLNCGVMGLVLKIQPPAPMALMTAAMLVSTANTTLATSPTMTTACMRSSMLPGVMTVRESKTSCWLRAFAGGP